MTREEAKAYIIRHCNPDYPKGKTEWEQAVNMAIKALEQPEPCENAVSREAAIRCCTFGRTSLGLIDELRRLPSVTPKEQPEIIRCKDCKYCEHWYADKGRCFLWHEDGIDVFEEGFCNYAERRNGDAPDRC